MGPFRVPPWTTRPLLIVLMAAAFGSPGIAREPAAIQAAEAQRWRRTEQSGLNSDELSYREHFNLQNPLGAKKGNRKLADATWNWGELHFGQRYFTGLVVHNRCPNYQMAEIFVGPHLKPYLSAPERVIVAPLEIKTIDLQVETPAEPPKRGDRQGPDWVHVDGGYLDYQLVMGLVRVAESRSSYNTTLNCFAGVATYGVYGHIHQVPHGSLDSCIQYWISGKLPDDVNCDEEFRKLAKHYVSSVLAPTVAAAPADWNWLPTLEDLSVMSDDQILAMKLRAEAQRLRQ